MIKTLTLAAVLAISAFAMDAAPASAAPNGQDHSVSHNRPIDCNAQGFCQSSS